MTLVSIPGYLHWPGIQNSDAGIAVSSHRTLDAAGEYAGFVLQAREDMTISHVGLAVSATGSPTADIRIETVSTTDGYPSGLWSTNTNVVTGALSTGWTLHAMTAPASISRGQIFAVRMSYVSGTSVSSRHCTLQWAAACGLPYEVVNVGAPTRGQISAAFPWALGSSPTTFYNLTPLFLPAASATLTSFGSPTKRGARFRVPFPCRCIGLRQVGVTTSGNYNVVIMDDSGAELGSSSTLMTGVQKSAIAGSMNNLFDNPVILVPGIWYRAVLEPTTATVIRCDYITLPSVDYAMASPGGVDFYLAEYASGSWTDSPDKMPELDLILDQIDDGRDPPIYVLGTIHALGL